MQTADYTWFLQLMAIAAGEVSVHFKNITSVTNGILCFNTSLEKSLYPTWSQQISAGAPFLSPAAAAHLPSDTERETELSNQSVLPIVTPMNIFSKGYICLSLAKVLFYFLQRKGSELRQQTAEIPYFKYKCKPAVDVAYQESLLFQRSGILRWFWQ